MWCFCFFNVTAHTEIYTHPLHYALPSLDRDQAAHGEAAHPVQALVPARAGLRVAPAPEGARLGGPPRVGRGGRSEEHNSELQSRPYLVCRLLLGKINVFHNVRYTYIDLL